MVDLLYNPGGSSAIYTQGEMEGKKEKGGREGGREKEIVCRRDGDESRM